MEDVARLQAYARQRGLKGPILASTVRAGVAHWWMASRMTRAQHRRYSKKYWRNRNSTVVPF